MVLFAGRLRLPYAYSVSIRYLILERVLALAWAWQPRLGGRRIIDFHLPISYVALI